MPPALRGTLEHLLMGTTRRFLVRCPAGGGAPFLPRRHRLLRHCLHSLSPCSLNHAANRLASVVPSPVLRSRPLRAVSPVTSMTVQPHTLEEEKTKLNRLEILKTKLKEQGISCDSCKLGQYTKLLCPKCGGGNSKERSFSLFIREDGQLAMWSCFRAKCGWRGYLQASEDGNVTRSGQSRKLTNYKVISEEMLQLEPLCDEIISWFSERMITAETLRRNAIMQRKHNNEIVIAFPYKRNGKLISCKYRGSDKKFFQERDTEKIFYGLDDIKQASDIIIVEGEMDKLAMEEAGFRNCVSVPDGAPAQVSKNLPVREEDTKYQYLWNCKDYIEKASRIILATDADKPGQALAEELARRIGMHTWIDLRGQVVLIDMSGFGFVAEVALVCSFELAMGLALVGGSLLTAELGLEVPMLDLIVGLGGKFEVSGVQLVAALAFWLLLVRATFLEVLMYLGPDALRRVIEEAELYPIRGLPPARSKEDGLKNIRNFNVALLCKWLWRLGSGKEGLCEGPVGRWSEVSFLASLFSGLFAIVATPLGTVAQAFDQHVPGGSWVPMFRRDFRQENMERLQSLFSLLHSLQPWEGEDCWKWICDKHGAFSIKSAYAICLDGGLRYGFRKEVWKMKSHLKVKFWRGGYPMGGYLLEIGLVCFMQDVSTNCCLCGVGEETLDHLFERFSYSHGFGWGLLGGLALAST
ncbi:hypothetical protein Taro_007925 [Colocasia esculenta]|uniref:Toprim domain-containing protein n=1 Tax=Colocasia esculenta TaxID=4460 RepID=A0A843U1P8_COLES|nr:hypothetical protein [Colocasia esculenta]